MSFSPDSSSAAANWVNRAQDEGAVMLCRAPQWACKEVRANSLTFQDKKLVIFKNQSYREDVVGWSTLFSPAVLSGENGKGGRRRFLIHAPVRDGDFGSFRQVRNIKIFIFGKITLRNTSRSPWLRLPPLFPPPPPLP